MDRDVTLFLDREAAAIRLHLQRLLQDPLFCNSKRYTDFLANVVERTLAGDTAALKERTLGIDVFSRAPGYDSSADPVVRIAAGEVRKRLIRYYADHPGVDDIRIEIPSGTYVPNFRFLTDPDNASPPARAPGGARKAGWHRLVAVSGLVLLLCGVLWIGLGYRHSAVHRFWSAMFDARAPILLCIGSRSLETPTDPEMQVGKHPSASDNLAISDAQALVRISNFLSASHKSFAMQASGSTTFSDLQRGPIVLVAWTNNQWTMRLTKPLRYHIDCACVTDDVGVITDRENPGNHDWSVDFKAPYRHLAKDYGIVARFHDTLTDQLVVVAAGLGEHATVAASALLTNESAMRQVLQGLNGDVERINLEVVFEIDVIDGHPGPPRVVARTQW
jgi:hypothetical protein